MKVYVVFDNKMKSIVTIHSTKRSAEESIGMRKDFQIVEEYEVINADTKFKSITETQERVYDPKHMDSYMPFGKYQGIRIDELIERDPKYIKWAIDNLNFSIDEECQEFLQEMLAMKGTK